MNPLDVALGEAVNVHQGLLARVIQLAIENVNLLAALEQKNKEVEELKKTQVADK